MCYSKLPLALTGCFYFGVKVNKVQLGWVPGKYRSMAKMYTKCMCRDLSVRWVLHERVKCKLKYVAQDRKERKEWKKKEKKKEFKGGKRKEWRKQKEIQVQKFNNCLLLFYVHLKHVN